MRSRAEYRCINCSCPDFVGEFPPVWSGNRLCCDTADDSPHEDHCAWVHGKWAVDELVRRTNA